jgi:post-segregation antitoxin (ccd killing protein)
MKRTNVILDEELLEQARVATGERTYSATINAALEDVVRRSNFQRAFEKVSELVAKDDFFRPGYVEEMWPEVAAELKKKRSADVKRLPRKTGKKVARRVRG